MLSITAVLGPQELGICIRLRAQGGSQMSTGREDIAGHSAVLPTLSEGMECELSDFQAEHATQRCDYLRQGVDIVI